MKFQKSFAARSALALVAAGSAVALTACGAGQITQTSNQAAAVNGTNGHLENVSLRDATIVIGKDGTRTLGQSAVDPKSGKRIESISAGMVAYVDDAQDVRFGQPAPSGGYGEYTRQHLHAIVNAAVLADMMRQLHLPALGAGDDGRQVEFVVGSALAATRAGNFHFWDSHGYSS